MGTLGLFALGSLGRVANDVCSELVTHVDIRAFAAGLAVPNDSLVLGDEQVRLRVLTRLAQHKLFNEHIEQFTQFRSIVCTIDDIPIVLLVKGCLSAEFAAEEFGGVGGGTTECAGDVCHVGDDSLDTVAFTLDLREQEGHTIFAQL